MKRGKFNPLRFPIFQIGVVIVLLYQQDAIEDFAENARIDQGHECRRVSDVGIIAGLTIDEQQRSVIGEVQSINLVTKFLRLYREQRLAVTLALFWPRQRDAVRFCKQRMDIAVWRYLDAKEQAVRRLKLR